MGPREIQTSLERPEDGWPKVEKYRTISSIRDRYSLSEAVSKLTAETWGGMTGGGMVGAVWVPNEEEGVATG